MKLIINNELIELNISDNDLAKLKEDIRYRVKAEYDKYHDESTADNLGKDYWIESIVEKLSNTLSSDIEQLVVQAKTELLIELRDLPNIYPEIIDGKFTHVQAIYKSAITNRIIDLQKLTEDKQ